MNKNSNTYIFFYIVAMVVLVAAVLSFVATKLKPLQDYNIEVKKKQDILKTIQIVCDSDDVIENYNKYIIDSKVVSLSGEIRDSVEAFDVNLKKEQAKPIEKYNLPIFIGQLDDGAKKYIIPLLGKGLWGPIWGYIALNDDFSTVYGASFSHKSETPGLGAEIATEDFQKQFISKKILNSENEFISIEVKKGGVPEDSKNAVDGVSGGTITSKGLESMIRDCMKPYMNYFKQQLINVE